MSYNHKEYALALAQFLPSMVKLNELQTMTEVLDSELAESQKIMKDIKTMFDTASIFNNAQQNNQNIQVATKENPEDISNILEASVPNLLLSDMPNIAENSFEDLDSLIATMKSYAENLRKNVTTHPVSNKRMEFENLDLTMYATSFDQLSKRLANVKLNKDQGNNRNSELEQKLAQLCQDVNLFIQMVQTKTTFSECNNKQMQNGEEGNALYYDNIINKLLMGINEVSYLLKSKQ
ncbi:uncharacterized protein [Battus philenor]|uniref:uncharacterized protein n=1 Tax=Battus philenor TaxID=42288 RepID=UPI0035CEE3A7